MDIGFDVCALQDVFYRSGHLVAVFNCILSNRSYRLLVLSEVQFRDNSEMK